MASPGMTGVTVQFECPRLAAGYRGTRITVRYEMPDESAEMPLDHPVARLLEGEGFRFLGYRYDND